MATLPAFPTYAELRCVSNFSFLKGASWPDELIERSRQLLVGNQFEELGEFPFTRVVLAGNVRGYGNLSHLISRLRRRPPKGTYRFALDDLGPEDLDECVVMACPRQACHTRSASRPSAMARTCERARPSTTGSGRTTSTSIGAFRGH